MGYLHGLYVEQVLCPALHSGDVAPMGSLVVRAMLDQTQPSPPGKLVRIQAKPPMAVRRRE